MLTPLKKKVDQTPTYRYSRPDIKLLTLANCIGTLIKIKGGK